MSVIPGIVGMFIWWGIIAWIKSSIDDRKQAIEYERTQQEEREQRQDNIARFRKVTDELGFDYPKDTFFLWLDGYLQRETNLSLGDLVNNIEAEYDEHNYAGVRNAIKHLYNSFQFYELVEQFKAMNKSQQEYELGILRKRLAKHPKHDEMMEILELIYRKDDDVKKQTDNYTDVMVGNTKLFSLRKR